MNLKPQLLTLMIAGLLCGCASFEPPAYRPLHSGNLGDAEADGAISVTLTPDRETIRRGEVLGFAVAIRNVSQQPVLLPGEPEMMLTWIYPDGRHDNQINGEPSPASTAAVRLAPGESLVRRSALKTYYFQRGGITEFRAIVSAAGPAEGWSGRTSSNGYGVMVE